MGRPSEQYDISKIVLLTREKTFPRTERRIAVLKVVWWIVWLNFCHLVSLITLPKMVARTWKWAISMRLDVISYNLCSKLGPKLICFWERIMAILVLPDIFGFGPHFPKQGIFISGTR